MTGGNEYLGKEEAISRNSCGGRVAGAVLFLLAASPAAGADHPWIGHWAGPGQDCALAGEIAENMPVELTATEEFGMEYSCEFRAVTPIGVGRSWSVRRRCRDAGFVEDWNVIWVLTEEDRLLVIDDLGGLSRLKRCAGPKDR